MPYFNSTAIARAEYDTITLRLQIWFRQSGGPYTYYGVPEAIWARFLQAPSKGRFFDLYIRDQYSINH